MAEKKIVIKSRQPTLLLIVSLILVVLNIAFLIFSANESRTITLLSNELISLEQDKRIITSAAEISSTYNKEIAVISNVFPNEETMPIFIQRLETLLKNYTDSYSFKFSSITPIKEQDRLYLPLALVLRIDLDRLVKLMTRIEKLPFMMHINSINTKTPDGFIKLGESTIIIKLYVQNPFTTK